MSLTIQDVNRTRDVIKWSVVAEKAGISAGTLRYRLFTMTEIPSDDAKAIVDTLVSLGIEIEPSLVPEGTFD